MCTTSAPANERRNRASLGWANCICCFIVRSGMRATCVTRLLSFPRDNKEWAQGDANKRFDSVNIRFDQANCRIDDVLRINSR